MAVCPICSKKVNDLKGKCPHCGVDMNSVESLDLRSGEKKKGRTTKINAQIEYEEPYLGTQIDVLRDIFISPENARSIFFSKKRPSIVAHVTFIVLVIITYIFTLNTKTTRVFVNGDPPSDFILITLNISNYLFLTILQLLISSVVFAYAFRFSFQPHSVGYNKPILTFGRLNIYRLLIHSTFMIVRMFLLLITPNAVQTIDLVTNDRSFTTPFPAWFSITDIILTNIPYLISAIVIYRIMILTFKTGKFNAAIAASFSIIPVLFAF